MDKATSVPSMEIRRRPIVTPKPNSRASPLRCSKISTKIPSTFVRTTTATKSSPTFFPRAFPILLVNGSDGIAVGMATKIPPHNLTEIVDATITLVNNPDAQLAGDSEIRARAPISPLPASFTAAAGIVEAYKNGRGRFMMRAKAAHRNFQQRPQGHHRHRNSVPGEQGAPGRAHRATGQRQDD